MSSSDDRQPSLKIKSSYGINHMRNFRKQSQDRKIIKRRYFCQDELLALDFSLIKDGNEEKGHHAYDPTEIDWMGKIHALKKGGNLWK